MCISTGTYFLFDIVPGLDWCYNRKKSPHMERPQPLLANETAESPLLSNFLQKWPTSVRCEMNIEEWRSALMSTNLLTEYKDVLEGFQEGFDQGIPNQSLGDASL
jgi:hypothetical protein